MIWLGLIEVKTVNGNNDLGDAKGAYVNVAYKASSANEFSNKVKESFNQYDFEIIEIEDVENQENIQIDNPDNAEKLDLIQQIENGDELAWGAFHTYDE